jgi:hypothetical protein
MSVLHGEFGSEITAERKPHEPNPVETERVEELQIVHHVVVQIGHCRVVSGFAEPWMKRDENTKSFGPGLGKLEAVECSRAMQEHQRFAATGREHDDPHAAYGVNFAVKFHRVQPSYSAARRVSGAVRRMRGITCSAIRLRFLTTFQFGMFPMAPKILKWLVPMTSPHSPSWLTT